MDVFSVGLIQMDSGDNFYENLTRAEKYISQAAQKGADMIMLPETMDYIGDDMPGHAAAHIGEVIDFYKKVAISNGVYIHGGSYTEFQAEAKASNTTVLVNPQGKVLAQYRKLHMFDIDVERGPSYQESKDIIPGSEIVIAKTKLSTMGFAICYDLRFPEVCRLMAKNGAKVLFLPANFTADTGKCHWETLIRARAIENSCYVVACGQTGKKHAFQAFGHSMVVNPWGDVVASMESEEGYLVTEIDLSEVGRVRRQLPSLENIREDVYSLTSVDIKVYEE